MVFRVVSVGSKLVGSVTKGMLFSSQVARIFAFVKERKGRQARTPPVAICGSFGRYSRISCSLVAGICGNFSIWRSRGCIPILGKDKVAVSLLRNENEDPLCDTP